MGIARLKSSSESSFLDFIKDKKRLVKPLLFLSLGIILLVLSLGVGDSGTENSSSDTMAEELAELLESVEGVGQCRVMISYESVERSYYSQGDEKKVYAVAVVCRGAKSAKVQEKVREVVSSLYGIGYNRVSVLEMN